MKPYLYQTCFKFIALSAIVISALFARPGEASAGRVSSSSAAQLAEPGSQTLVNVTTSVSPAPIVGQVVSYHVEVSALEMDLPNVGRTIVLPAGVDLIQGDLHWHGDIAKDQTVTKDLTIRVTTPGNG